MKHTKVLAAIGLLLACWLVTPAPIAAIPPAPATFYGPVKVNGQNIPDGTEISAWIGGVKYVQAASFGFQGSSYYNLSVPGDDPDTTGAKEGGAEGERIIFMIGGSQANETATWQPGFSPYPPEVGFPLTASTGGGTLPLYLPALLKNSQYTPPRTATPTATPTRTPPSTQPTATPFPTALTITRIEDTYIHVFTEENRGAAGELQIKTSQESKRPLIRFDLSGIPSNAMIESAMMTLWTTPYPYTQPEWPMEIRCYLMRRHWEELEATWVYAGNGQPWGIQGADDTITDREGAHVASTTVRSPSTPYTFNITGAVRQWVANPASNHGMILIGDGNISEYRFWSSDWIDGAFTPKLDITLYVPRS